MGLLRNKLIEMGAGLGYLSCAYMCSIHLSLPKWAVLFAGVIGFFMIVDGAFLNWDEVKK